MADVLSDEQAQALGLDDAPEPSAQAEHPLPLEAQVKEPGGVPVSDAPQAEDRVLSDQEAKALGLEDEPPPAPTVNPRALQFVSGAGAVPPADKAAQIIRYSAASGLPANLVAADLENIKKKVDASGVDWQKLAERQPALAQYLADNPHALHLVQGDAKNLGVIEAAFGTRAWAAFMDAWHEQGTVGLQFLRAEGVKGLDPKIQARLDEEEQARQRFGPDYGATNFLTRGAIGTVRMLPYMVLDKLSRALGAVAGAIAGATAGAETGPGAAVTGAAGGALSQFVSAGLFNYAEFLGPESWRLDHLKDENGQPINRDIANAAAQMAAITNGAFMAAAMGVFGNPKAGQAITAAAPGLAKGLERLGSSALSRWLVAGPVRETIAKFLGRWGLHTAIGAVMMATSSAINQGFEEAARAGESGLPTDGWLERMGASIAQGAEQGLKDMWLMSGLSAVRENLAELGRARLSAQGAAKVDAAISAAKDSTVLAKSPDAFEQIVQSAAPDGKIYVPAERWVSYFQGKKIDPAQAAESVGVPSDTLSSALATGGNIEMPVSEFLGKLTKDGHAEGLAPDVKTDPEHYTPNEFKAKQESEASRMASDAKAREEELTGGKKVIEDFIVEQAKASKERPEQVRQGAKLIAKAVEAQALRLDIPIQEAAKLMNLGELAITGKSGEITPEHRVALGAFREWLGLEGAGRVADVEGRPVTLGDETSFEFGANVNADLEGAHAAADRMAPENRDAAKAFIKYTQGEVDKRPDISDDLVKKLAKFGVVDPQSPFPFDESGRSLERSYGGRRSFGDQPDALKEARARTLPGWTDKPYQRQEGKGGGPRGEIRMDLGETGKPRAFNIAMLNADKSTFVHEAAHFLSWSLHDLALSEKATPEVKQDYETLLKFMGYENPEARLSAVKEGTATAQEEKASHAFEQYLLEGRAPSQGLARVFSRLKDWLVGIYKGAAGIAQQYRDRYGQELQLSDDVRGVFDRLLAQDEALRQAWKDVGGEGEMKEALAGMTPEEAEMYRQLLGAAKVSADQEAASGGPPQTELEAQREAFKKQTAAELDQRPVYKAWRYLQHGDFPEGVAPETDDFKPFKLSRDGFLKEYGEEVAKLMPPNAFRAKGGVSADELAPLLGYNSGDDLVHALIQATPRDEAIAQGAQDKMDAAHGPELQRQTEAALSGVHNAKALEAAVMELRALAKQIDPAFERRAQAINVELIRRNIDRMTSQKTVGDLDPVTYARVERKLALEAAELWGKGEKEASYDKREQRMVNKLLFMSERDARQEMERGERRISRPSEAVRADLGKADPAYRDVHDTLLAAVGLGAPQPEAGRSLDELLQVVERDGQEVGGWVDTVRGLLAKPADWGDLTVDQARDVMDAVTNIRHAADETLNVIVLGKKQKLQDLNQAVANRTATVRPAVKRPAYGGKEPSARQKLAAKYRGMSAALQEMETIADMMDGGSEGPMNDLVVKSRLEARDKEVEIIKGVLAPLKEAFGKVPKDVLKLRDQAVDVAHLLPPPEGREAGYTRSFLWSLFLNMGNEGNLQRLQDGNKWDYASMHQAISLLSRPELEFLQTVRDVADSLYPHLAEAYERRTGLRLGKVEATPIEVNGQQYRGGYWPIRYDREYEGNQGTNQEINDLKDLLPSKGTPTVTNSATKARVQTVRAPLDLTWSTVPAHFATVIHDIAYGDWVRQVGKAFLKPRIPDPEAPSIAKTAADYLGQERAKEFLPWLRDIAADRVDSTAGHVADAVKGTGFLRTRLTAATLMLNLPSLLRHTLDPWVAATDLHGVPLDNITTAYLKVNNPLSWGSFEPFKQSEELEYRRVRHDDNLKEQLAKMGKVQGLTEWVMHTGFALQKWMDMYTSRVTFRAAYDDAIANGATPEQAVQRGDEVVRRTLPSGDIAEKPPLLRTKSGWAAAVMFYGYAAKLHNIRSRAFDRLYRAWNADSLPDLDPTAPDQGSRTAVIAEVAAKMMGLGMIGAAGQYIAGRGPTQKEDNEKGMAASRAEWLSTEVLMSPMDDAPPLIGPAVKAALLGHKVSIQSTPELTLLDHQLNRLGDALHGKSKADEAGAWGKAEALIGLLGPVGQAHRTVPFLQHAASGQTRVRGPFDFGAGVIYGDAKNRGANPLTDLQSLISGR